MEGTYRVNASTGQDNVGYQSEEKPPADLGHVELHDMDTLKMRHNGHATPTGGEETKGDLVLQQRVFDPDAASAFSRCVMQAQTGLQEAYGNNKVMIWRVIYVLLLIAFLAYVIWAVTYRWGDEGSQRLVGCTVFGLVLLAINLFSKPISKVTDPISHFLEAPRHAHQRYVIRWVLYVVSAVAMVTLIIVLVALDTPDNLTSLAGLAAFIVICWLTSHNPAMVDWHPVYWGFTVQFFFAVIILKTQWGYDAFDWLGKRMTEFLAYSDAGAKFVFGDVTTLNLVTPVAGQSSLTINGALNMHYFAFRIMPVVTYFSAIISVLYYLGVMQAIIKVIGKFLAFCLGTTPAESLNAAGNIFFAMTESPFMIRPFLPYMTTSELHAVMTGGFATIAGSVLGAYIGFGVPADHLLTASVMSAPAALAISKLTYPECEVPIIQGDDYDKMEEKEESGVIEAACVGAMRSAGIIAGILVNLIAFLSILAFVNATLTWFGDRVGIEELTFELICSYVLYPIALFMGTDPADCRNMAELIGIKTFTNEFIAYENLQGLLNNRKMLEPYRSNASMWYYDGDDIVLNRTSLNLGVEILKKGVLTKRSEIIATYALCGFSNMGSMGILLGGLSTMVPNRRPTMAKIIFRAMLAGNMACFFTACIAGLFYTEFD